MNNTKVFTVDAKRVNMAKKTQPQFHTANRIWLSQQSFQSKRKFKKYLKMYPWLNENIHKRDITQTKHKRPHD